MHEHGSATGSRPATSHDPASAAGPARVPAARSVRALPGPASADGRSGTGPGILGRSGICAAVDGIYGVCSNP
ncbi:hypothetical protein ACFQ7F_38010 [Streptomyces sp. NPDC056486]|uniref:hypothetical protein n=1 Tax=Streptomyces sp. NPDC056486 TaxID=3345835 RepID=UPI0036D1EE0E